MQRDEDQYRLRIPLDHAFAFSVGEHDLGYEEPTDQMRQLMGVLVIDSLQYCEQWRVASEARAVLAERWPECPSFCAGNAGR
jgi:hypothetical protein